MIYTIDLGVLGEIDLDIDYDYSPGNAATWIDPPEPAEFEITNLNHVDLNRLLRDYLDTDDNLLQTVHEYETIDREVAHADHYNDMKRESEEELWT